MGESEFLSTGEAAAFLNVSRSTVSRKYDQGQLRGKTNPVTGERLVSRESLLAFMRQYNLPGAEAAAPIRTLWVCSPGVSVRDLVVGAFLDEARVQVEELSAGCDVLMRCAQMAGDVVVLDPALSDIAFSSLVDALQRGGGSEPPTLVEWSPGADASSERGRGVAAQVYADPGDEALLYEPLLDLMGLSPDTEAGEQDQ